MLYSENSKKALRLFVFLLKVKNSVGKGFYSFYLTSDRKISGMLYTRTCTSSTLYKVILCKTTINITVPMTSLSEHWLFIVTINITVPMTSLSKHCLFIVTINITVPMTSLSEHCLFIVTINITVPMTSLSEHCHLLSQLILQYKWLH